MLSLFFSLFSFFWWSGLERRGVCWRTDEFFDDGPADASLGARYHGVAAFDSEKGHSVELEDVADGLLPESRVSLVRGGASVEVKLQLRSGKHTRCIVSSS